MAVEYKLYNLKETALVEQLAKEKEKLKNSFSKSVEGIISKNYDNQELKESCEKLIFFNQICNRKDVRQNSRRTTGLHGDFYKNILGTRRRTTQRIFSNRKLYHSW